MKGSSVIAGLCFALLCAGCSEYHSPVAPSPASQGSVSPGASVNAAPARVSSGAIVTVPFKGSLQGEYGTPTGEFPLILESIAATGNGTHLGSYTLRIEETVNLVQATATGTFTFTAANGDTLSGTFTGHAQSGPPVTIQEEATIGAGTGRFAGAAGNFVINRVFDPAARTTSGTFNGVISSPGRSTN